MEPAMKQNNSTGTSLAAFVNAPPRVFMHCTAPEISALANISVLVFVLLALLGWAGTGNLSFGVGVATCAGFGMFYALVRLLAALKKAKPEYHYLLLLLKWRAHLGLRRGLVVRSGAWHTSRRISRRTVY